MRIPPTTVHLIPFTTCWGCCKQAVRLDSPAGAQLPQILLSRVRENCRPPISEEGPVAGPHMLGRWAGLNSV
jgi:hypothetical protein